jgi:hypothetical protein
MFMPRTCNRQFRADGKQASPGKGHLKQEDAELRQLKRENEQLRRERDVLKKSSAHLLGKPASVFGFISEHCNIFSVKVMCRVLEVSRSGYYSWSEHKPSKRQLDNQRLDGEIREIYYGSEGHYGSLRIVRELQARGRKVGKHRVVRRMRHLGIRSKLWRNPE